jgi:hypothetical protein
MKLDAEQQNVAEVKAKEVAAVEFAAEQEYLKTLSYLSQAEQKKYKERQSMSFMHMKLPGSFLRAGPYYDAHATRCCQVASCGLARIIHVP